MKLKLDENLPESLIRELRNLGHDVDNVRIEGLVGRDDENIWRAVQEGGRFFITQDLDFSDVRRFAPGSHCGLMLVRLRLPGRLSLATRVAEAFRSSEAESWASCFVVLTDHKLRVRRP